MKKLFTLFLALFPCFNYAQAPCEEIFMSEIVDGNFKDKIVELYNPTDQIKDLSGYHLRIFKNGSPTPDIIPLSGTLATKETYVVTHPQANSTILSKADLTDVKMNFTGSDAIVLRKGISTDIDKIGEIGIVPGANGWVLLPTGNTKDSDIRRKYPVDKGETNWNNGKQQWTVHPKDSIQNVKQHNNVCNQPSVPTCIELFISEYLDGNQKDKAIEVFNPTESTITLSDYALQIFQNGAPTPINISLQGTINPKETYVVTHPQANSTLLSKADLTSVNLNFDGNDAIVLKKGISTYVDKIGEIAVNPGANGWQIPPSATTKDVNLRRKFLVDDGETDWNQGKNQWEVHPNDSIHKIKQHQNICTFSPPACDIIYSFQNPLLLDSTDGNTYFQFDIHVKASNDSTYFAWTNLWFRYDTLAFGSKIVQFSKVRAMRLPPFDDTTYSAIQNMVTGSPYDDAFGLTMGLNNGVPQNRVNLTDSLIPFIRVWIRSPFCSNYTGLEYFNLYSPSVQSYYSFPSDTLNGFYPYSSENFENILNVELPCDSSNILWIMNFTQNVYPGTYYKGTSDIMWEMQIQGTGFNNQRGNGNVWFINADYPNDSDPLIKYTPLNSIDFISWNDSLIKIKMPSVIDTLIGSTVSRIPGSGKFFIKNDSGDSLMSNAEVKMPYAIRNTIAPDTIFKKMRFDMVGIGNTGKITFNLDSSVANNPKAKGSLIRALHEWQCVTGIKWEFGSDVIQQSTALNGTSLIYFDDTMTYGLAATRVHRGSCLNSNGDTVFFPIEIDMRIARGYKWFYDTTGLSLPPDSFDFFAVVAHELGHGHILEHVNDTADLMYYGASIGPKPAGEREDVLGSISANAGGREDIMVKSQTVDLSACFNVSIIEIDSLEDFCQFYSVTIKNKSKGMIAITVFPNPADEYIHIVSGKNMKFTLYDVMGLKIFEEVIPDNEKLIDVSGFPNGIFLYKIILNEKEIKNGKIIIN